MANQTHTNMSHCFIILFTHLFFVGHLQTGVFVSNITESEDCSLHTYLSVYLPHTAQLHANNFWSFNKGTSCKKSLDEFLQAVIDFRPAVIQATIEF